MEAHPISAILQSVRARLAGGAEVWGQRVYHEVAPVGTRWPVALMTIQDARQLNWRVTTADVVVRLAVKVVSDDLEEALRGAQRATQLLDDAGDQDVNPAPLGAGGGWRITTVTQERLTHYAETLDGRLVYHCGGVYRVVISAV